jgi:ankyrin repeat protein
MLIEHGASIDKPSAVSELTPLLMAAQNGHLEVVRVLIACCGSVDAIVSNGITPL